MTKDDEHQQPEGGRGRREEEIEEEEDEGGPPPSGDGSVTAVKGSTVDPSTATISTAADSDDDDASKRSTESATTSASHSTPSINKKNDDAAPLLRDDAIKSGGRGDDDAAHQQEEASSSSSKDDDPSRLMRQLSAPPQMSDDENTRLASSKDGGKVGTLERPKKLFQRPPEEWLGEEGAEEEYCERGGPPPPPDGGWGWMVVFASFMIHVFADGFTYTLGIFYVYLLNYYGVSKAAAAWIVSILVGVTLGSGPISGTLVNKFGCRIVTIAGAILASVMLFVSIFAQNISTLYFTIGIGAGLGFGLIYLPAIVCVAEYFEKRRSFATGIAVCGSGLGTFVFSPLVEYLIAEYNWKGALIIISGLVLNCVFFGALFRPLEDRTVPSQSAPTHLPTQYSEGVDSHHQLPAIEVTGDDEQEGELRKNLSDVSLPSKFKYKRNRTVTSPGGGPDDIQRISSHGFLIPLVARRALLDNLRPSASQPLFARQESADRSGSPTKHHLGSQPRLLNRKDIFYSNSLLNIPEYKNNPTCYRSTLVRQASHLTHDGSKQTKVLGCIPCSQDTLDSIHSLTDWALLKDPIFQLFALSNFLTSIGFNAPYVFIVDRALDLGIPTDKAPNLLAVIGISNTVSRVVLGYISDRPWINRLYLYNIALTTCGVGTCASIWMNTYGSQIFYAAVFGSMSGAYVGLTSVVLVDLLGMERLTNAFGLVLLAQGLASVIGPPLCGSLYEMSDNYNYTFLLAGTMIAISGLILFAIPAVKRCVARRNSRSGVGSQALNC